MKFKCYYLLLVPFFYLQLTSVSAAPLEDKKILAVTGVGSVDVVPDKVSFSIGVQTEDKKIKTAQNENNKKMQVLEKILEKYEIPKKNLKTQSYSIFPVYDYQKSKSEWKGYAVSNRWNIQLLDITKLTPMIDELSENATYVQDIRYGIKNSKNYQQEALSKAIADAKAKAQFIAKKAGLKIKSIFSIQDSTDVAEYPAQPFMAKMSRGDEASSTPFQEGTLTVEARVRVVFNLSK